VELCGGSRNAKGEQRAECGGFQGFHIGFFGCSVKPIKLSFQGLELSAIFVKNFFLSKGFLTNIVRLRVSADRHRKTTKGFY
jgi:hypothetical protein